MSNDTVMTVTVKGIGDFSDVVSNVGSVQKALTKLKLPDKLGDNLNKNITNFYKEYEKYQKKISEGIKTQGDYNQVEKSLNNMRNLYQAIGKDAQKLTELDMKDILNLDTGEFKKIIDEMTSVMKQIGSVKIDTSPFTKAFKDIQGITKNSKIVGEDGLLNKIIGSINTGQIAEAKKQLQELQNYAKKVAPRTTADGKHAPGTLSPEKYQQLTSAINSMNGAVAQAETAINPLIEKHNNLQKELDETKQKAAQGIVKNVNDYNKASSQVEKLTDSLKRMHQEEFNFNRQATDISRQIQQYFGLTQIIRKVGDIARDAFATVKELDKAMTETAVVTNFSVGDMWDMLPTYTQQANQLGSTIRDVYEAATLYYQQGLNTNQAMSLANETLKMARIAGLDAADATNMMTAALRGFNMEINQQSAQKINDIYSELAAITASDTKEIGSAMERTASIANSANMEFATTSAFLAQMIETTREAPENLGTAMKTIVARFQEMKQDPTKLVDSEGVAMDANKVDKALKTIGVQLMNTKGEFRDLDDVFLDISAKWDSLTQGQQRYIATIAAGSRQQSRFIAMMSNYERTMELVDAANNSAGASQRQFEKTLDSMEAKLNKLKNAWDQFTMGLMNNQILKFGVSALTEGFTIINKFIDILGKIPPKPFEGVTKSLLTLVSTVGLLKLGGRGASAISGGIFGWLGGEGFSKGFNAGWTRPGKSEQPDRETNKSTNGIIKQSQFSAPIVKDINSGKIANAIVQQFNKAKQQINSIPWNTTIAVDNLIDQSTLTAEGKEAGHKLWLSIQQEVNNGTLKPELATIAFQNRFQGNIDFTQLSVEEGRVEQLSSRFDGLGTKISSAGMSLQQFGSVLQGTPLEPFGNLLTRIGVLMVTVGDTAVKMGRKLVTAFIEAKTASIAAGGGLNGLKAGASAFIGVFTKIPPHILLIIAAIAAAIAVVHHFATANKRALEAVTDAAAAASEAYDSAKQETSELADAIEQVKANEDAFDGLVVGTAAFNEQLVTANDQIMELIKKYPMLNDYLTTDKNGLMHISDEGLNAVKDYQKQLQANASALNLIQTADLNSIEAQQKAEQMRKTKGTDTLESLAQRRQEADLVEQQAEAQQRIAKLNAVNTTLVDKEIGNREKVSAILADQYDSRREAINLEGESIHDLKQEYADFYGYKYDKSTKKITDIEGNEIDVDKATIKDAVKDIRILTDIEVDGKSLDNMINHIDSTFSQALGSSFEESGNLFSDILSDNINIEDDLLQKLLTNPDKLQNAVDSLSEKEIAAVLGVSADAVEQAPEQYKDELTTKLTEKATNIAETQAQSYADLASMLAQTTSADIDQIISENGRFITQAQVHNKQAIEAQLEQLTSEQKNTLSSIGKALTESAGADTMRTFIKQATDIYTKGTKESVDTLDKVIKDVNWSSPTARLKAYNDMVNSTDKDVQNLGNSLRNSSESSNLLGEAFEEFYDSSDFQELAENMDKFVDSSGKLNASSVQEMAQECNSLNNLLDTGAISAGGVAAALNAMGRDGNITILDLNENLLKFLSTANQLDDVLSEAHSLIENFDWGIDTGESEDFAKDSTKKWKELYDNGEFGNQQLENYAKFVLGQNRWNDELEKSGGNIETALNNMSRDILKYSEGFEQAWLDMANSSKIQDVHYGDNGDIIWDTNGKTTQELVDWLAETRGITQEWAKLMVEDFANYSYDFKTELANNDYTAALKNGDYIEAHRGADNTTNITQSEVAALAAAQNKTEEEILKDIQKYGKISEDELNVIKNIDENGNLLMGNGDIKSLNTQYSQAELGKDTTQSWISQYEAKTPQGEKIEGSTDLKSAISAAIADGFQSEQATEMARMEALEAFNEGAKVFYDGVELNKEDLEDSQAFAEKVAEITENSRWNAVGEAIAQGYISYIKGNEDSSNSSENWTSAKDGGDKKSIEPIDWSSGTDADIALREEMRAKARENWSQLWSSIKEAFTSGTPIEDPKVAATEQSKENWKEIWTKVKEAFTSGEGVEDPKVEAANKAKENWKSLWDKVKEAFTNNPDINIDPKVNNNNNGKSTDTGSTEATGNLAVTYTGKVANPEELKASLEQQITALLTSIAAQQSKMSATATVNVKQGTIEKPKAQKAIVNYTKGKQAKADKQTTTVDYKLGSQAAPKAKTAPVNYTLGTQAAPKAKTIDISPHFVGSWEKTITLKPASRGMNNTIDPRTTPSFGSAAKGRYGTVGPKNKGGLTLTGEEGFEIAWLPSENRSMILGAKGPQLTNLPADTVVYTHEQSKKIIKQKAIPAGSHAGRHTTTTTVSTSAGTKVKNNKDTHSAEIKQAAAEAVKITQKAGKVLVWWENAGYRMDKAQRNAEGVQRELKNLLKQFGTTAEQYKKSGEAYEKYLNQQIKIAEEKEIRAKDELSMTTGGRSAAQEYLGIEKTAKEENTQQAALKRLEAAKAQLKKAKKTKGKGDDKKAQKKVDKLQKKYDETAGAKKDKEANEYLEAIGARQEISYEVTKKTKNKKGKWKKTKTTKKTKINTANYIQTDPETGALQINQDAIDNIAKTNKSKAQAITDAVEKQLNELLSKQKEAEDEKIKAEEALAEFYDTTYETFYSWDKVITEAYLLGQQLEKLSNLRNIYDSVEDLEFAKLEAGFSDVTNSLPKVVTALERNKDIMVAQVQANSALVDATWSEYQKAFSIDTYKERYESSPNSEKAAKDYDSMKVALDFLDNLNLGSNNFDYQAAVNSLNANEWSQEDFEKIKDGLDKIAEKQGDYYNAIADTYTSIADVYKTIEEYQSYMADFESSLIKGLEEQANKEIDSLSKLNDTLSTAAKDLIDEVKRKLDERRKQEDNRKTEQDISQKQQRLAMLRANTSSGNQVEIARLEKEIAEAQQGYGRTLEDQLLDRLSQQQDEAAKQRERQISLLEAQRDLATALGTNVDQINTWLAEPEQNKESIRAAWLENQGYSEVGAQEKKQLEEAFEEAWTRYLAYGKVLPSYEEIASQHETPEAPEEVVSPIDSINQKMNRIIDLMGKGTAQDQDIIPPEASTTTNEENPSKTNNTPQANNTPKIDRSAIKAKEELDRAKHEVQKKENLIKQYEQKISTNEQNIGQLTRERSQIRDSRQISALNSRITSLQSQNNSYKGSIGKLQEEIRFLRNKYKFKKGGLASSTGPAWLDGTPTKPELVLNAQDTQNFLALRDILSKVIGSTNSITNSYGGNATYEININVDKIEKDYDVDRVIEKVKKEITKGAGYRNVTQVRSFR